MLDLWIRKHGEQDLKTYTVFSVEEEITVAFPHLQNFSFTCRPDTILQRKNSKDLIIMETKTSAFSWKLTELGVLNGEQATTYLYAVRSKYPGMNVLGVQPDISYWNKGSELIENILNIRPPIVERSNRDTAEFTLGVSSVILDISARVQSLEKGEFHPVALFPRNTAWCNSFNRHCEFLPICRIYESIKRDEPPPGYVIDPWRDRASLINFTRKGGLIGNTTPKLKGGPRNEKGSTRRRSPAIPTRKSRAAKPA
jgi:hypothetical protein